MLKLGYMILKIASWNIETRLSNTNTKRRNNLSLIIKTIKEIDADILVLPEAHSESSLDFLKPRQQLLDMGYKVYNVPYRDDTPLRADAIARQVSLVLLSKFPVEHFDIVRLGDFRDVFIATVGLEPDQFFRVIGLHLDDRSEITRLKQVTDLVEIVNRSRLPTVVPGDFNSMHGEDLWPSKFLRSRLARLFSHIVLSSISLRAIEMARGEALKLLETSTNLIDADTKHSPTTTPKMLGREWLPSIRLIQIDHIFVSKDIKVNQFYVASDGGADHRAIVARLSIK